MQELEVVLDFFVDLSALVFVLTELAIRHEVGAPAAGVLSLFD